MVFPETTVLTGLLAAPALAAPGLLSGRAPTVPPNCSERLAAPGLSVQTIRRVKHPLPFWESGVWYFLGRSSLREQLPADSAGTGLQQASLVTLFHRRCHHVLLEEVSVLCSPTGRGP